MPIHPPRGHLPACIAPLYILARALHDGFPAEGLPEIDLRPFSKAVFQPLSADATYRGERRWFDVKVSGFRPSRIDVELLLDLVLKPKSVRIPPPPPRLRAAPPPPIVAEPPPRVDDEDEDEEGPDWPEPTPEELKAAKDAAEKAAAEEETRPKRAAITLVPPYGTCLLPEHLSATARWRGWAGIPPTGRAGRTFPADGTFRAPSIAAALVAELRNVLADGGGRAALIEQTGMKTAVPAYFWTSDAAEAVLAAEVDTAVRLEGGREIVGTIWFDEVALDAAWRQLRSTAAALVKPVWPLKEEAGSAPEKRKKKEPPHTAVPQPTLWMVFMQEIALEFGYSGGRPVGSYRFTRDQLAAQLRTRWPKELGDWSQTYAEALAAFILHPNNRKEGNPNRTTKQDREQTQAKIVAGKTKSAGRKNQSLTGVYPGTESAAFGAESLVPEDARSAFLHPSTCSHEATWFGGLQWPSNSRLICKTIRCSSPERQPNTLGLLIQLLTGGGVRAAPPRTSP